MQTTDEDRIRLALGMIGAEAAGDRAGAAHTPVPVPVPVAPRRPVRRALLPALILAASVAAVALVLGTWTDGSGTPSRRTAGHEADAGMTWEAVVPCTRMIAEGDVVSVREAAGAGRVVVTFAVDDWLRPARGRERVDVEVPDPAAQPGTARWKPGEHLLLVVYSAHDQFASDYQGDEIAVTRAAIEPYLKKTEGRACELTGTWRDAGK
ncbi:hypothetical protein AB0L71_29745 [Streptomyces sp. NPDC052052]|uniref:hypothetical protein n=1 Tax=Streptomyces sp. NPDC052052 TaxID=3154756 RepID=UPI003417BD20